MDWDEFASMGANSVESLRREAGSAFLFAACRIFFKLTRTEVSIIDWSKAVPSAAEIGDELMPSTNTVIPKRDMKVGKYLFVMQERGQISLHMICNGNLILRIMAVIC
jgi:hypothetical protein